MFRVAEEDVAELDVAAKWECRVSCSLDNGRFHIDQRKDPLRGRQPCLELAPKGREIGDGEPKAIHCGHKEVPGGDRDGTENSAAPAKIDQNGRSNPRQNIQRRENIGNDKAAPHIDFVSLLIHAFKILIDSLLLAKIFGHANARYRLLRRFIHFAQGPRRLPRDAARHIAKAKGGGDDEWSHD